MNLYHGTDKKFNVGDLLNPNKNWIDGKENERDLSAVYATPDFAWAECFAVRRLYSHGMNKIDGVGDFFTVVSSDMGLVPFSIAKGKKYYVYRVGADGFELSDQDNRSSVREHLSESPVEVLEIIREGILEEWLDRGNKVFVVPDSIMIAAWPRKKSIGEILSHVVPYRDWVGAAQIRDAKTGGRD
jgi:hypothetical protein